MRISQEQAKAVLSAYCKRLAETKPEAPEKSQKAVAAAKEPEGKELQVSQAIKDELTMSSTLQRIVQMERDQRASHAVSDMEASRRVRAKELKNLIREGQYEVSSEEIAEKIIARLIADELS
jgi:anti-sigma28 factor (negative regulator of flagellin synthesis)